MEMTARGCGCRVGAAGMGQIADAASVSPRAARSSLLFPECPKRGTHSVERLWSVIPQ